MKLKSLTTKSAIVEFRHNAVFLHCPGASAATVAVAQSRVGGRLLLFCYHLEVARFYIVC